MGIFDGLMKIGGKLGMVRIVSTTAKASPRKIPMRSVSLKELAGQVRQEEVKELAAHPAELSVEFAKVFEAAGVKPPPHGWTVRRLAEALHGPAFQGKDRAAVQRELLRLFTADGAQVHEVLQDAVARDHAIDAYEEFARTKLEARNGERQRRLGVLQSQIEDLQKQIEQVGKETQEDKARWRAWHDRKVACEKEMAWAVSFLVENPVITVDSEP